MTVYCEGVIEPLPAGWTPTTVPAVQLLGDARGYRDDASQGGDGHHYPASTTNFTVAFWLRFDATTEVDYQEIWQLVPDGWTAQPAWTITTPAGGSPLGVPPALALYAWDGSGSWGFPAHEGEVDTGDLTVGQWYYVAYVKAGTLHTLYVNGVEAGHFTLTQPAVTDWSTAYELLGASSGFQGEWSIACFRVWEDALTLAELTTESQHATAQHATGLFRDIPLDHHDSGADASPNGYDYTVVGEAGIADVSGPVVTAP